MSIAIKESLSGYLTNRDNSVFDLSHDHPIMLVFLRHFGCIFCREALNEIADKMPLFKSYRIQPIFVHMSDVETAQGYFEDYGIPDAEHISDPECALYASFQLAKGNFNQLFGLKNWIQGFKASTKGIPISLKQVGDGMQMPGIFMIWEGRLVDKYVHKIASDSPDYEELMNCCAS